MQKKEYLIEPVQLKRIKAQLEYRLRLQNNIKELQTRQQTDETEKQTLFARLKKLF